MELIQCLKKIDKPENWDIRFITTNSCRIYPGTHEFTENFGKLITDYTMHDKADCPDDYEKISTITFCSVNTGYTMLVNTMLVEFWQFMDTVLEHYKLEVQKW